MSNLTEADKKDFISFIIGVLNNSANTIANEGKQGITFDTEGYKTLLTAKLQTVETEEGKEKDLEDQKLKQTAIANNALEAAYKAASETANAIVGHVGDAHTLSHIIHKHRGSMHQSPTTTGTEPPVA